MNPNDPKLTAYILDELTDADRSEVESAISADAQLAAEVEHLRATAESLETHLKDEASAGLTQAQRAAVLSGQGTTKRRGRTLRRTLMIGGSSLLAASLLFAVMTPHLGRARQAAQGLPPSLPSTSTPTPSPAESELASETLSYQLRSAPSTDAASRPGTLRDSTRPLYGALNVWSDPSSAAGPPSDQSVALITPSRESAAFAHADEYPQHTRSSAESYAPIEDNAFQATMDSPLSTFSIDVDTAAYANMRRFIRQGTLPPPNAVRIEEMINYFSYDYPQPTDAHPFSVSVDAATAPWAPEHRLVRIGLKGREVVAADRPPSNLVFLIDVSGSMRADTKLPLLRKSMKMLVERLDERDRIAIVVYAGSSGLVLPSTPCDEVQTIMSALDGLRSGGSTHGSAGIRLAYETARAGYIEGGVNRVILATDGDFNVGITDRGELTSFVAEQAKSNVFLTVLGFGMGNLNDATLESISGEGNGTYAYIDTINEARKVLGEQLTGTLITIAKDVKIQVEFNPAQVAAYRLIGYENRILAKEDFNDDTKDAGEIGAGHTVTALYEIVPVGQPIRTGDVDPLKYQTPTQELSDAALSGEMLTVKLRYKPPTGETSTLMVVPFTDDGRPMADAPPDLQFSAAVASYGMLLRNSPHRGTANWDMVLELAESGMNADRHGYRTEFMDLVRQARAIAEP
jgi:Ca-activated chloride channel family protein